MLIHEPADFFLVDMLMFPGCGGRLPVHFHPSTSTLFLFQIHMIATGRLTGTSACHMHACFPLSAEESLRHTRDTDCDWSVQANDVLRRQLVDKESGLSKKLASAASLHRTLHAAPGASLQVGGELEFFIYTEEVKAVGGGSAGVCARGGVDRDFMF